MKSEKHQVPAGRMIGGRYNLVRTIGQGGMAQVYLAEDSQAGDSLVAVKVLKDDLSNDPEFVKRFDTEARAASSLDHPNIVKVLDYGQDGPLRYIVQEYVEGSTLKDLIVARGTLNWQLAVPLAIQIGLALEHAHRRGIVHRDIKPHNILITPDMVAKVTDFGIARAANSSTITLTSGVTFGSVHYFSPEQARGSLVGEKSDLYSLGILLYEMITGQVPFDGETSVAIAIKHLQEMPRMPSALRPDIPRSLDNIVIKCIQKSPDNRYQDARELIDELDAFMVDPEGVYGILTGPGDSQGNTTAIGLKRPDANYSKLREIERTMIDRRRSRQRDLAIVISIILLSLVFMAAIGTWAWDKIKDNLEQQPTETVFEVENYVGRDLNDVLDVLKEADIKYRIEYRENSSIAEGIIFDQYPGAGILIRPNGTTVVLYVSGGQDLVTIPDYAGETMTKAKAELEQTYGFKVIVQYEYSDFSKDRVIKTIPAANTSAPRGSEVTLFVSEGLPTLIMPDLVGKTFIEAKDELINLNLIIGPLSSITVDPETGSPVEVPENQRVILQQSPKAGEEIMVQSIISLTYGTQQDYFYFLNPTPTPSPTPEPTPTPEVTPEPTPEPTPTPGETTAPPATTAPEPTPVEPTVSPTQKPGNNPGD